MKKYLHSLAGRLALWYAAVFSLCFLAVFGTFYLIVHSHFQRWTEENLRDEVAEARLAFEERGPAGVEQELKFEVASAGSRFMGRIIDEEGRISFQAAQERWDRVPVDAGLVANARLGIESFHTSELSDNHAARIIYSPLPPGCVLQLGLDLFEHEAWMSKFSRDLFTVALLALMLSGLAGWFMARRALSPVREIARTASKISGQSLGQRVPVPRQGGEVGQLAESFNDMLGRIDTLVRGLRDVTDSLAHDMRTPITGIRGIAEVTLRARRNQEEYREALSRIIEQLDRLLTQFNSILDVAEAESGALALQCAPVCMGELAMELVQVFEPVAVHSGTRLDTAIQPDVTVSGDPGRLRQVVANLLDNALKFTPPGGHIRLAVEPRTSPPGVSVTVSDTGRGIAEKDLPHIFERYYRGDRSRSGDGIGLGLPLVRGIVQAHGGTVTVESRPGQGSVFLVFLPSGGRSCPPPGE